MRVSFSMMAFCAAITTSAFAAPVAVSTPLDSGPQDVFVANDDIKNGYSDPHSQATESPMQFHAMDECCDSSVCRNRGVRCSPPDCGNWLTNMAVFSGFEAYKGFGDTTLPPSPSSGYMNSAGFVNGLNTSLRLGQSSIRGQLGGSVGIYDLRGRDTSDNTASEPQGFLTAGVYKRSNLETGRLLAWGLVYDQFWANQWGVYAEDFYLGQIRGIAGVALNCNNEIGMWGTVSTNRDDYNASQFPGSFLRTVNQYNLYLKHSFEMGGSAMVYAGLVDRADFGNWTLGSQLSAPLSNRLSLYGNYAFLFPSSSTGNVGSNELLWGVSTGLSYSFGNRTKSRSISGNPNTPLLPVANNGTMIVAASY